MTPYERLKLARDKAQQARMGTHDEQSKAALAEMLERAGIYFPLSQYRQWSAIAQLPQDWE